MSDTLTIPCPKPGSMLTTFAICCAVCNQSESGTATHVNKFLDDMLEKKWRLTSERGYVHKACMKLMPNTIKMEILSSKPNLP